MNWIPFSFTAGWLWCSYRCVHWQSRIFTWHPCHAQIANVPRASVSARWILSIRRSPCLQCPVAVVTPYHQPFCLIRHTQETHQDVTSLTLKYTIYFLYEFRLTEQVDKPILLLSTPLGCWKHFLRVQQSRLFTPRITATCCILPNICVARGDILEEEEGLGPDDSEDYMDNAAVDLRHLSRNHVRLCLAANLSSPDEVWQYLKH